MEKYLEAIDFYITLKQAFDDAPQALSGDARITGWGVCDNTPYHLEGVYGDFRFDVQVFSGALRIDIFRDRIGGEIRVGRNGPLATQLLDFHLKTPEKIASDLFVDIAILKEKDTKKDSLIKM